uniref:Secreted protein n=1 Tax=Arundo donax TaxID=35708 RepID=A0A0A9C050_ARUDO
MIDVLKTLILSMCLSSVNLESYHTGTPHPHIKDKQCRANSTNIGVTGQEGPPGWSHREAATARARAATTYGRWERPRAAAATFYLSRVHLLI